MKNFYIIFASLFAFSVSAQDSTYSKVFYHNSIEMEAYAADNTIDSGYVMVGVYGNSQAFIIRMDSLSNEVWSKSLYGGNDVKFTDVIATSDSGYLASGTFNSLGFCVKYDALGDTLWTKTYDAGFTDGTFIIETFDSNYVFAWGEYQGTNTNICKVDATGNILWSYQYIGPNSTIRTIVEANDSSLYIGGGDLWGGQGTILKLNSDGQLLWSKGLDIGQIHDFEFFEDSVFALCLDFDFSASAVIKMDTSGSISWSNRYPGYTDQTWSNMYLRSYLNKDSTLLFTVPSNWAGSNTINRIDLYGNLIQSVVAEMGTTDIIPSINNGSYIIGIGPINGIKKVWIPHIGVIRADSVLLEQNNWCIYDGWANGFTPLVPNLNSLNPSLGGVINETQSLITLGSYNYLSELGCVDFIGSVDEHNKALGVSIYPNSSDGIFNMAFESEGLVDVIIIDQLGRTIYSKTTNSSNLFIDLSLNESGIYHYKVSESKTGRAGTGKLILIK